MRYWTFDGDKPTGFPEGWDNKPVTWVSREDADAYCRSRGARLPETWEWQYAMQGTDGRRYPWGNTQDSTRHPRPSQARDFPVLDDVDAHPTGASPFGVEDCVGNVFQ